MKIAVTLPITF